MGLSTSLAFGILITVFIVAYVATFISMVTPTRIFTEISQQSSEKLTLDICDVLNISIASPSPLSISANISNNGSISWWNYNNSYVVADLLLVVGANISMSYRVSDLSYMVFNDLFNPGITDPGEILQITIAFGGLSQTDVRAIMIIFITQTGSTCSRSIAIQ
jgi:hypothetical protein